MNTIVVGSMDQVLGTVSLDSHGEWILLPTEEPHREALSSEFTIVFTRFQEKIPTITREQFLRSFYRNQGMVQHMSAWAKPVVSNHLKSIVTKRDPQAKKFLEEMMQHKQTFLVDTSRKRA